MDQPASTGGAEGSATQANHSDSRLDADARAGTYVLPPDQARFYWMHELAADAPVCNLAITLRLVGAIDPVRLQRCLDAIVEAHPVLRSRFRRDGNDVIAEPLTDDLSCPWNVVDLSPIEEHSQDDALTRALRDAARQRFDLTTPPLLRATLVRTAPEAHVLMLVGHHLAVDGTAMFHLIPTELCTRYEGRAVDAPSVSCAEWSIAQRARDAQPEADADCERVRAHMQGATPTLQLPIDHPFPDRPTLAGDCINALLDPSLAIHVRAWSEAQQVRPFDVMCAAYVAQLMRYSGSTDVTLGVPVANRGRQDEARTLINCCIDTLLLRVTFDHTPSFVEIVQAVSKDRRQARQHRTASFTRRLEALDVPHGAGRNPIYQAMFNYMEVSVADVAIDGLHVVGARFPVGTATLDLSLDVIAQQGSFEVALEHNADVFDRDHAQRMLTHYMEILRSALQSPHASLADLNMLSEDERERVLTLSRGPEREVSARFFHGWLWERTHAHAASIALRSDHSALTYAALFVGAEALADRWRDQGVGVGTRVAILKIADPCDTVRAMFAVWLAGGVIAPMDATEPLVRLRALLEDSGATHYVADEPHTESWARYLTQLSPDVTPRATQSLSASPMIRPGLTLQHPACIMYTSGSTGAPKGVLVSHANLAHQLQARIARYDTTAEHVLAPYSFAFDSFLAGLTLALAHGATLHMVSDDQRRDPRLLRDLIQRAQVTHLDMVPSLYAALLSLSTGAELASLRVVVCGGEALPQSVVEEHWRRVPSARLFNEYGPTETTVFATVYEVPRGLVERVTPIGRPISNAQCWILDRFDALAPLGHAGEVVVGGDGVALGYHPHDAQTPKRFGAIANVGSRLYRTGDVGRYRADGNLEFLGRVDQQIQVRGYRVEPGEIETALRQLPSVIDAAVVWREDLPGPAQLVGYVTTSSPSTSVDTAEWMRALRLRVPSYMVPSAIVVLDRFPTTTNGKLDRAALPRPVSPRASANRTAARTDTEATLVNLWQEVLGIYGVGVDESFFDLGGHSMLAIRLVGLIETRLGHRVSLAALFREPTPSAIAKLLDHATGATHGSLRCVEQLCSEGDGVPLVFVGSLVQGRKLAAELRRTRKVIGLNMFGLHAGDEPPSMSVSWVCDEFVREVREVLPQGPYALAAYCGDSKIAYEMAQRLRAMGQQVQLLALIDAVWWFDPRSDTASKAAAFARQVRELGVRFLVNKARRHLQSTVIDAARDVDRRVRAKLGKTPALQVAHETMVARYLDSIARHEVTPNNDAIVLYVSQEWRLDLEHPVTVPLRVLPGRHDEIFDGHQVKALAALLDDDLAAIDPLASSTP